ncbi:helix-turn-helix domain-containing protein [Marinoscillum sp. MHG1-6]|uniref:helix-turn-helix domain-containing protein n=1 Tax=Marinoscillum sp. MHG1-6 TaxID=2959627 RepID=UPI0021587CAF|nr:helix-turn-helix domain-containing protein [Marinoscillum sp. MHG1-6]
MEINDRISELITTLQLNPNSFADAIGVKGTVIYNIVKGRRSKPSYDVLQKILLAYHGINANWLLNGEGDLWKDGVEIPAEVQPGYVLIENRLETLAAQLREDFGEHPAIDEIEELCSKLIEENVEQRYKIISLYEKQDQILDVIRKKLSIDL